MKNILIIIVICVGSWQYFVKDGAVVEPAKKTAVSAFANNSAMQTLTKAKKIAKTKANYQCDGRQYCSQMKSYEEARYFIQHCPNTKMDGDNDGIPCERQFKK